MSLTNTHATRGGTTLITARQAAEILGVSKLILNRIVANGDLAVAETAPTSANLPSLANGTYVKRRFHMTDVLALRTRIEQGSYQPFRWNTPGRPTSPTTPFRKTGMATLHKRITEQHQLLVAICAKLGISSAPAEQGVEQPATRP